MNYTLYILKSLKDSKHYTGVTNNISRRLKEHNNGEVKSTRNRRPLKLIYTETFQQKKEVLKREKFFKMGTGREKLKKILEN